ncbi:hypothetical protein H6F86_20535 [Phormidium sp. FACHB-592]|uniref:Uncharacterized protein n=1 Tax=Stenomitos frigidus AS-A4 TaxID=2933935 RepID=A0ABV0KEH9_9CYAN|nr:hypothetical protein [Phormidium sp. FACHB-592]MBD2076220.1 hypothetical protein [Phormidium sp. FACHB-592]
MSKEIAFTTLSQRAGKVINAPVFKKLKFDSLAKYFKLVGVINNTDFFENLPASTQALIKQAEQELDEKSSQPPSTIRPSTDSLVNAIAKFQKQGIKIDSATALDILKQHKDGMSKYDRLVKSLAAKGADDPKALAAAIGRKKLGKKRFQARAKAGARKAAKA